MPHAFAGRGETPTKLEVMKVRASWMQSNILNVGWERSDMRLWDEISAAGNAWKAFDNSAINPLVRCLQSLLPTPEPMQIDEQQPQPQQPQQPQVASQGPSQSQPSRLPEIAQAAAALGRSSAS